MLSDELLNNPRFHEFVREVRDELEQAQPESPLRADALRAEKESLENQCEAWVQSLGRPLSNALRTALQEKFDQADQRIQEIAGDLNSLVAQSNTKHDAIDPERIAGCLEQLAEILAGQNASAANLMLSQHIEGIFCDSEGTVVVRTCRLGSLAGALELVPRGDSSRDQTGISGNDQVYRAVPRRRAKLNVGNAIDDDDALSDAIEFAVDPERFGGLGKEWFTEDIFSVPPRLSWAQSHAKEVAEFRLQTKKSMELTSHHFGKTIPTIRAALRYAKALYGLDAFGTEVSMSTRQNWSRDHATEVEEFFLGSDATMKAAVAHFGKTDPTIRKALAFARARREIIGAD